MMITTVSKLSYTFSCFTVKKVTWQDLNLNVKKQQFHKIKMFVRNCKVSMKNQLT